jgi:hypothetical protein
VFFNRGVTDKIGAGCSTSLHSATAPVQDVTAATYITGAYGRWNTKPGLWIHSWPVKLLKLPSIRRVTGMVNNRLQHNSWKLRSNWLLQIFSEYVLCYFIYRAYLICIRLRKKIFCLRQKSKLGRLAYQFTKLAGSHYLFVCFFVLSAALLIPGKKLHKD